MQLEIKKIKSRDFKAWFIRKRRFLPLVNPRLVALDSEYRPQRGAFYSIIPVHCHRTRPRRK